MKNQQKGYLIGIIWCNHQWAIIAGQSLENNEIAIHHPWGCPWKFHRCKIAIMVHRSIWNSHLSIARKMWREWSIHLKIGIYIYIYIQHPWCLDIVGCMTSMTRSTMNSMFVSSWICWWGISYPNQLRYPEFVDDSIALFSHKNPMFWAFASS